MSGRNRPSKTNEQIRNEQVALVLGELEKDIENFKATTTTRIAKTKRRQKD